MKQLFGTLGLAVLFAALAPCAPSLTFSATATGTGATSAASQASGFDGGLLAFQTHTLQVIVTGSPSGCTVRLEGSLDGTNFFDLSGTQTCTSNLMFHVNGKPVSYVRANLLTWTGGTNAVISYRGSN